MRRTLFRYRSFNTEKLNDYSYIHQTVGATLRQIATVFFADLLLGLIHGEYKPKHALVFALAYLATTVPALIAGRSLGDALGVYVNQSVGQYYDRLTYNAPNLYTFFPMLVFANTQEYTWMRYIAGVDGKSPNAYLRDDLMRMMQDATLYACVALVLIVVIYWLMHAKEVTPEMTLDMALFFAIFLPFVMPKIHVKSAKKRPAQKPGKTGLNFC